AAACDHAEDLIVWSDTGRFSFLWGAPRGGADVPGGSRTSCAGWPTSADAQPAITDVLSPCPFERKADRAGRFGPLNLRRAASGKGDVLQPPPRSAHRLLALQHQRALRNYQYGCPARNARAAPGC